MPGPQPQPWFWKARKTWAVVLGGRRVTLGRDRAEAFKKYHRLLAGLPADPTPRPAAGAAAPAAPADPAAWDGTAGELADLYLADLKTRVTPEYHRTAARLVRAVLAAVPPGRPRPLADDPARLLTPAAAGAAVRGRPAWGTTYRSHAVRACRAMTAWAVTNGLLAADPLRGLKAPPARARGAEALVPPADRDRLLAAAEPYLRDVLTALADTGCRPGELTAVTAADFDPAAGAWTLAAHKTAYKSARPRVVFLTPAVVAICVRLAARHPTGPLFRTAQGRPFAQRTYLPRLVRNLRRKLGLPETVIPYGLRHTMATDLLANGTPAAVAAELLGNSPAVLMKHYGHLDARRQVLRDALQRARPQAPEAPTELPQGGGGGVTL